MTDRELMQMALDALGVATTPLARDRQEVLRAQKALRDRLAQPEPTGREIQKIMQSAWKAVSNQYKDDPECCFALGWEAGYGAVAPRVEPPETESGEGFESLPAPSIKQPEPVAYVSGYHGGYCVVTPMNPATVFSVGTAFSYTAPPKREWVGLTDEEAWKCWDWEDFQGTWKSMESKLKEKNT